MVRRLLFLVLVCLTLSTRVAAQDACELSFARAQEEFDAGRFYAVPGILKECLAKNPNREFEQRAYLLLAETYLLLDNAALANECYLRVLQADPEFVTDPSRDPIDLVYLSQKFTATPIFSVRGHVGLNTSFARVIHDVDYSLDGDPVDGYSLRAGWHGGIGLDYHYSQSLAFSAEVNYTFTQLAHRTRGAVRVNTVEMNNQQTWIAVPLLAKYSVPAGLLRPYAYGGVSANVLLRDRADVAINSNIESPEFDFKPLRRSFGMALVAGAGIKYKIGLRYLYGDIRYNLGLTNVATSLRWNVDGTWLYVDDDFRLDNLLVNIGYIHPIYKARELKKARTKSVLRILRRRDNGKK